MMPPKCATTVIPAKLMDDKRETPTYFVNF